MNKKGFTLVELLGVIVILSIILLIAIPNITAISERTKKDGYINDASRLVSLVKYDIKKGQINKPAEGESLKVKLKDLSTNDVVKDKDGLVYNLDESYVYVSRENGEIVYYVQLIADKKSNDYRGILLVKIDELTEKDKYKKYFETITELEEITPKELNENKSFEVGIAATNVEISSKKILVRYNKTKEVVITPKEGYYLSSASCTNGYTVTAETGIDRTSAQTVTIANNGNNKESTCSFVGTKISYYAEIETKNTTASKNKVSLKLGGSSTIDITPKDGYYLSSASCTNGYTLDVNIGVKNTKRQTVTIYNNKKREISKCTFISLPAYPKVTGESNVWTNGTRTFTVTDPVPSDNITRYEYYVSNSNKKPGDTEEATNSFTRDTVTVTESGKYIYFRIIYKDGTKSDWTNTINLYVDNQPLEVPTVIGGGTDLVKSRTFILISPESISGISEYQYYISDEPTRPARSETPTMSLIVPTMTITSSGKYIYFRVINNARVISEWTEAVNLYVDNQTYIITYELNGGVISSNETTKYSADSDTFNLPIPTRKGYNFEGWYEKSDFSGNKVDKITKGTRGNKNFYAKWTPIVYTINYDLYGGTQAANPVISYTIETADFNLPIPTKVGHKFNGWIDSTTNEKVAKISRGTIGNKAYNASWSANSYTVTLNQQGGSNGTASLTAKYEYSLPTITIPVRAGYKFLGYYSGTNGSGTQYIKADGTSARNWNQTSGATLYAKWIPAIGTVWQYNYTGGQQTFVVPVTGTYSFEVYGAQGASSLDGVAGKGGYASGRKVLSENTTLYINVGGSGSTLYSGGYNGGGGGQAPGGGATHIATASGILPNLRNNVASILIVAGGGGGAERENGGAGGGYTGGSGYAGSVYNGDFANYGSGGSQTSGGAGGTRYNGDYPPMQNTNGTFGQGGSGNSSVDSGAGGGGGYYGGGGATYAGGGGGGSSYVGGLTSPNTSAGVRTGNGYAKITLLSYN